MLTFTASDEKQSNCFKFIGCNNNTSQPVSLITGEAFGSISLITSSNNFDGGLDTCSFYSGPSDATIFAFGESAETTGSIAYAGESSYTGSSSFGSECCGSIASSSSSSFSGGGSLVC